MNAHVTLLLAATTLSFATTTAASTPGYLSTSRDTVVKSGSGLCWHTGAWNPAKALPACDPLPQVAPAPVAQPKAAPVAQPEPKAPPAALAAPRAAPVIERLSLEADVLFDFDSADLRPAGRAKLHELAQKLHDARVESIQAIGHTDRIASQAYNDMLSGERASAVKAYLTKIGFDPRTVQAESRGESEPVTGNRCSGLGPETGANAKLVACLQADRRVEIEVRGETRN